MDLFDRVMGESGEWTEGDQKVFREFILSSPTLRKAFRDLFLEAEEQGKALVTMDLTNDALAAVKHQGKVQGMKRALDSLLEKAQDMENEDDG